MKTVTVLYHRDADGFGAAYAAWTKFKDSANYIGVQYGEVVPEIPEGTKDLFILDFSYDRATCEELSEFYALTVLDHHKTAQAELEGLPYAQFNMNKSGCRQAWEYFWEDTEAPLLLQYIEDRDLWRWQLKNSEEINLFIATLTWDFDLWDYHACSNFEFFTNALNSGVAIKSFRDAQIAGDLRNVRRMRLQVQYDDLGATYTYDVPVANASANISELGNEMCKKYPDAPFSVSYCDRLDVRSWSLRSIGDFDVSLVAKAFGGGGHRNAAGFTTEIGWPQMQHEDFLKAFDEETKS